MAGVMAEGSLVDVVEVVGPGIVGAAAVAGPEGVAGDGVVVDCRHSSQPMLG